MSEPSQAILADRRVHVSAPAAPAPCARGAGTSSRVAIAIHDDLAAIEAEWRRFETRAECTVFQTFDWLSAWQRHIGTQEGITPAIVVGRGDDGELLFLMPLAVKRGILRRLIWLGCDLCDYNAPILATGYSLDPGHFRDLWREICRLLQLKASTRHDIIELTKMPEAVGAQRNPLLALDVGLNPSGAHLTHLHGTWDEFYQAKRSSATRRRDRSKRKRLAEFGELRFVTPREHDDLVRTMDTLVEQKARSFARMGVTNMFDRPGHREFFIDLATNPATRRLVHVSRLEVGPTWAAVNLGLAFRECYHHVLASYDDGEVSRFGPGAAHLRDLLRHAIKLGCRRFDFTIGDERYKLEWSDTTFSLFDHVAPATARGWPLAALILARRRVKRAIKQTPVLWSLFSRLRSCFGARPGRGSETQADPISRTTNAPPIAPE
ncbi:MAG: hypothetical protein QOI12_2035 [Alphaproteobacteria bacterium]|jgi:CelD/BcsL family acetyltransferase involved in cellulose biosynthesis|nr:hypothetical protein [Alphaproteobacteria bacterium]